MGPKDAPTITKNPIRFAATPVTAKMMAMVTPTIVEAIRGTLGIMVLKLFPAINAQKHAGGTEASVNRKNMAVAIGPPMALITSS